MTSQSPREPSGSGGLTGAPLTDNLGSHHSDAGHVHHTRGGGGVSMAAVIVSTLLGVHTPHGVHPQR